MNPAPDFLLARVHDGLTGVANWDDRAVNFVGVVAFRDVMPRGSDAELSELEQGRRTHHAAVFEFVEDFRQPIADAGTVILAAMLRAMTQIQGEAPGHLFSAMGADDTLLIALHDVYVRHPESAARSAGRGILAGAVELRHRHRTRRLTCANRNSGHIEAQHHTFARVGRVAGNTHARRSDQLFRNQKPDEGTPPPYRLAIAAVTRSAAPPEGAPVRFRSALLLA